MARVIQGEQFKLPGHIRLLNRHLVGAATGQFDRLMIFMPPQHGKSHLTSETFPAWYLAHNPDHLVSVVSYNHNFARGFGLKCRNLFRDEVGPMVGLNVSPDVYSAAEWHIDGANGGMKSVGRGGALTGRRTNLMIIDDPIKNDEEAMSKNVRESVWNYYKTVIYTRLAPDAIVIVIQTRWHNDDLSGRLLESMEEGNEYADQWKILKLPALATEDEDWGFWKRKKGDALWPEQFDRERLLRSRAAQGQFWFSAMYMQEPIPEEGTLFKRDWFEIIPNDPGDVRQVVRYWDFAGTAEGSGGDPDYTVGTKYGYSPSLEKWVVLDVVRFRGGPGEVEKIVRQTAEIDGRGVQVWVEEEPGSAGKSVTHNYRTKVLLGFTMFADRPTGSKRVRAIPISSAAEAREVVLVRNESWNREWLSEVEVFPLGTHDDQVDSWSGAHNAIANNMTRYPEGVKPFGFPQRSKWNKEM